MTQANPKSQQYDGKSDGFTLIEVAVLLVVLGLLSAAFFASQKVEEQRRRIDRQNENITAAQRGLREFIQNPQPTYYGGAAFNGINNGGVSVPPNPTPAQLTSVIGGRYPCPADPAIGVGNPGFGVESLLPNVTYDGDDNDQDPSTDGPGPILNMTITSNPNGVCNVVGGMIRIQQTAGVDGPGDIIIGALPIETLNIDPKVGVDAYNNQFTYAVTAAATTFLQAESATPTINPVGVDGTDPPADLTPFVVISHGPDQLGAYSLYGVQGQPCGGAANGDSENCDLNDFNFVVGGANLRQFGAGPGTSTYFDDTVIGALVGGTDSNYWDENGGDHIYNLNFASNGNIGVGTDSVGLSQLQNAKLNIQSIPGTNLRFIDFYPAPNNTNNAFATSYTQSDALAIQIHDFVNFGTAVNPNLQISADIQTSDQGLVFENLDANTPDPDDGWYFLNNGTNPVLRMPLYISPTGWARIGELGRTTVPFPPEQGLESARQAVSADAGRGFVETAWLYTSGVEASSDRNINSVGIAISTRGQSPFGLNTVDDDIGVFAGGRFVFYIEGQDGNDDYAFDHQQIPAGTGPFTSNFGGIYIDAFDNQTNGSSVSDSLFDADPDPANTSPLIVAMGADNTVLSQPLNELGMLNVYGGGMRAETEAETLLRFDNNSPTITFNNALACDEGGVGIGCNDSGILAIHNANDVLGIGRSYLNGLSFQDEALRIAGNNNVGINIISTTPTNLAPISSRLQIFGDTNIPHINLSGDRNDAGAGVEVAYITINTPTASGAELGMFMNLRGSGDSSNSGVWDPVGGGNDAAFLVFEAEGAPRYTFWSDGETYIEGPVGVSRANPIEALDIGGNPADPSTGTMNANNFNTSSDRRLKTDITPLDFAAAIEKVLALNPVSYDQKQDHQMGFIAQDVMEIWPQIVRGSGQDGEYYSLNYQSINVPLIGAAQYLWHEKIDLEARIAKNQQEMNDLRQKQVEKRAEIANIKQEMADMAVVLSQSGHDKGFDTADTAARRADIRMLIIMGLFMVAGYMLGLRYQSRKYMRGRNRSGIKG